MPTIAERSVSILLKAIRTRHPSPDEDAPASAVTPSDGANGVRLRELRFNDFDAVARLIPGARYTELPGVGHLVPWEAPDATLRVLTEVAP